MKWSFGNGVSISFDGKPSETIRSALKSNGFRWNREAKYWWRRKVEGAADFLAWLEKQLNPGPDGDCRKCGSADGYWRQHAARTALLCADCNHAWV